MTWCRICATKISKSAAVQAGIAGANCASYLLSGYVPCWRAYILTDAELSDPAMLRDGRNNAARRRVPYRAMLDYLTDLLRDFPGVFIDRHSGKQILLDMAPLEDAPVTWFRDVMRPCADDVRPRLRIEAKERWRIALTILRATDPDGASWGVANDNTRLIPSNASGPRA